MRPVADPVEWRMSLSVLGPYLTAMLKVIRRQVVLVSLDNAVDVFLFNSIIMSD